MGIYMANSEACGQDWINRGTLLQGNSRACVSGSQEGDFKFRGFRGQKRGKEERQIQCSVLEILTGPGYMENRQVPGATGAKEQI